MTDDDLRAQLGKLVRELVRESETDGTPITPLLRAHLFDVEEVDSAELTVVTEELESWELPNLQLALEALQDGGDCSLEVRGLSADARHYDLGLGDLCHGTRWGATLGPPDYVTMPIGPDATIPCLAFGVLLVTRGAHRIVCLVRRTHGQMGGMELSIQALSPSDGAAAAFLGHLRDLMRRCDVYRGKVLTVVVDPMTGSRLEFVERPSLERDELVLPDGLLAAVERNVIGPSRHREALVSAGRHLSRGLLLWGPPGTGKTHTVRYLIGQRTDATVIIVSGGALGAAGGFVTMARRLAPALLVLEDVDLVAEERTYGPFGSSPVLFELMNQMDGLPGDADLSFVLTTNRADALEPALAARPGRIDLAVEIPLPDADCRRKLLELYARGMDVAAALIEPIVARTEGVTASFLKELLRAAVLHAADAGRTAVTEEDLGATLDRLLSDGAALTRVLLGGSQPRDPADHNDWLRAAESTVDVQILPGDYQLGQ